MTSRRNFVKIGVAVPFMAGTGSVILLNNGAHAFFPVLAAKFIIGGFIRGAITRSIARTVVTQGTRQIVRAGSRSAIRSGSSVATRSAGQYGVKKNIQGSLAAQFGLSGGVSVSISSDVFAKAKEYNADAIWVNHGHANNFDMEFVNDTEEQLQGNISFFLRNVEKNKTTNEIKGGYVSIPPASTFKYPFQISDLPYDGIIKLSALSGEFQLNTESSGNIVVAKEDDISFDD